MIVLHANWTRGSLHLWAEGERGSPAPEGAHPAALDAAAVSSVVTQATGVEGEADSINLRLPSLEGRPIPSNRYAHIAGVESVHEAAEEHSPKLASFEVPSVRIDAGAALTVLEQLSRSGEPPVSASFEFFAIAGRFARRLLAQQRFVPSLLQDGAGEIEGAWMPWLADEASARDAGVLAGAMPPAARAVADAFEHAPAQILESFLATVIDAECRQVLTSEDMMDVLDGRDSAREEPVAWLNGLLGGGRDVPLAISGRQQMIRSVRRWIGGLEERGASADWRLCLRVNEPIELPTLEEEAPEGEDLVIDADPRLEWSISFHLQLVEDHDVLLDAADIWLLTGESATIEGRRVDAPQDLLLSELGRASRIFSKLEKALGENEPVDISLPTKEAYTFLREMRPILGEQGFGVIAPPWWDAPASRIGAKLLLDSGELSESSESMGLDALVGYEWQISIGSTTLTLKQFEELADRKVPLIRLNGKWVEIRPEDVRAAIEFIRENPGGQMRVGDAIRIAFGTDAKETGLNVVGIEASGWLGQVFGGSITESLPKIEQPGGFQGSLRPYQLRGLSWLAFLERFGFGACLADDMGLGKTIQLLALMSHERETADDPSTIGPTLLVVPTSVVGNWQHEAERFCPHLKVLIQHGADRSTGDAFIADATESDLVITTYSLAHRDRDSMAAVPWRRVVLDEAQSIKNPGTKQAQAVRSIEAGRRVALTGTPVENRLSELWSIMEFLNPGYLGTPGSFRRRFGIPIERYNDQNRGAQLRGLVQPFLLRRLKTDPNVVTDLPPKVESREYCHLTPEQAEMYEACVKRTLADADQSQGIERRGVVLAALVKLKQICNHPSQALKEIEGIVKNGGEIPSASRSGKASRILDMIDELVAAGDQALVFTQFRQMGHLLSMLVRQRIDRDMLFLHGGTPSGQRTKMVQQFQKADGTNPIMIVSLKAGGVGLNLTAANHVFHFDRWWNPAVENQATDRAYRIGQTRTVQVHKFVCRGTLEERIDEMIEQKTELAEQIVGSGEQWLTELDTNQLKELLSLRRETVGVD